MCRIIEFIMTGINIIGQLRNLLESDTDSRVRVLAFLSALIAESSLGNMKAAIEYLRNEEFDSIAIYEAILQSYLFLGFPRMIEAALVHNEVYGDISYSHQGDFAKISDNESIEWYENGVNLCRQVYGKNYDRLKQKFLDMSPEIFRWMVNEGYGKVLTRPGLNSIERELAEVAALIVDERKRQLHSHVIGSLNVGAGIDLIRQINIDIKPISGDRAFHTAEAILEKVCLKQ